MQRLCTIIIVALVLSACATQRPSSSGDSGNLRERAERLVERDRHDQAVDLWLQLASSSDRPAQVRVDAWLQALESLMVLERFDEAERLLRSSPPAMPSEAQQVHADLLGAEISLRQDRLQRALALLTIPPQQVPVDLAVRFYATRGDAFQRNREYFASARDFFAAADYSETPQQQADFRDQGFRALSRLPLRTLGDLSERAGLDAHMRPWLQLALTVKQALRDGRDPSVAIDTFREQYPEHPASEQLAGQLREQFAGSNQRIERIAILLPLSGRFGAAGTALRNGLLAAYYSDAGERPKLLFIDTANQDIVAYEQAQAAGADRIIGPLTPAMVSQLAQRRPLTTPTIALNYLREQSNALPDNATADLLNAPLATGQERAQQERRNGAEGLYQLGLDPERDAEQVAALARRQGYERALVLAEDSSWGERVSQAFVNAFSERGGQLAQSYWLNEPAGFSDLVAQALDIEASRQRYRRLRSVTGRNLAFEPTARQDVDMIFLAAQGDDARLINPLLSFHHGDDLPVLATAQIYAGFPDTERDRDLDGILFCDAPSVVNQPEHVLAQDSLSELFGDSPSQSRLHLLGMDAYRMLPYVDWLAQHPDDQYPGESGDLSISKDGRIKRNLSCAQFRRGMPAALRDHRNALPANDSAG